MGSGEEEILDGTAFKEQTFSVTSYWEKGGEGGREKNIVPVPQLLPFFSVDSVGFASIPTSLQFAPSALNVSDPIAPNQT